MILSTFLKSMLESVSKVNHFNNRQTILIMTLIQMLVGVRSMNTEEDTSPPPHRGGEIVRGLPCVKRLQQGTKNKLSCGSAGNTYPSERIDLFIDDNKALIRRMYGELQEPRTKTTVRVVRTYRQERRFRRDILEGTYEELLEKFDDELDSNNTNKTFENRNKRQADYPGPIESNNSSGKEDVCQSSIEVVTPFWASNSNGKVRAIVNNQEFEQAIHQEICGQKTTARCTRDCACEQRYKWHRLLAYDPADDCRGVFMDWFLFPSCCVCRCNKNPFLEEKDN